MRAHAYIDGFNLYNRSLRDRSECKWLDFDQVGALTMAREHYGLRLVVASPRNHHGLAKTVGAEFYKPIHEDLLRACQLPDLALNQDGREIFRPEASTPAPEIERPPKGRPPPHLPKQVGRVPET